MAKEISNIPSQSTPISQPENTPARTRGRHGAKEVSSTETTAYQDKSTKAPEGQKLTSRKIIHHNLDMITQLAERGEWSGLASAIQLHGNTLSKLDLILTLLKDQDIKLPSDIQNTIGNHFSKLYALEKIPELTRGLI
ncbi:hypothetical protein [Endozoicomonas sp.]|uniref:hypothetical protein n=1 Tax=Endozoicomonas sp. TaxID=1892382 RepID=UPI002887FDB0|nr:hypothetical protein [Endozoicomonas sp.]